MTLLEAAAAMLQIAEEMAHSVGATLSADCPGKQACGEPLCDAGCIGRRMQKIRAVLAKAATQ